MTEAEPFLVAAVTAEPDNDAPRAALQDELREHGRWTWQVVYGHVLRAPRSDGLRLLAADYLEGSDPEPCAKCDGEGVIWTITSGSGVLGKHIRCPDCGGLKHDARKRQNRVVFIRSAIALDRLQTAYRDGIRKAVDKAIGESAGKFNDERRGGTVTGVPPCPHTLPSTCPECRDLFDAIRATWDENECQDVMTTYGFQTVGYDRGFVGAVTGNAGHWIGEFVNGITSVYPITRVNLTTRPDVRTTRGSRRHHSGRDRARIVGMPWVDEADHLGDRPILDTREATDRALAAALARYHWPNIDVTLPDGPFPQPPLEAFQPTAPDPATWNTPDFTGLPDGPVG